MAVPFDAIPPYEYKAPDEILKGVKAPKQTRKARKETSSGERQMVQELRAKYLQDKLNAENIPYIVEVMHHAFVSGMSPSAFMELWGYLAHAKKDGTRAFPSHQLIAHLTDRSVSASERATKELSQGGWLITRQKQRAEAVRSVVIPKSRMDAIVAEILDPSKMTVQKTKFNILEPSKMKFRTVENAGLTITPNYQEADYHEQGSYSRRGVGLNGYTSKAKKSEVQS